MWQAANRDPVRLRAVRLSGPMLISGSSPQVHTVNERPRSRGLLPLPLVANCRRCRAEGRGADTQQGREIIPKGVVMIGVVFDFPAGIGSVTFWPWTWWNSFATWWNQS